MAQDHSVLGLQLLISFLSVPAAPTLQKWCVQNCVLDLLGGALPMELLFLPTRGVLCGMCLDTIFSIISNWKWDCTGITEK